MNYNTTISDSDKLLLRDSKAIVYTTIIVKATSTQDEIILTESDAIKTWEYSDERYVPSTGFIGQFVARELSGELQNISDDFNIEDREIQLLIGVGDINSSESSSSTRWYSLGSFIIQKPEDNDVNDNTSFEAMDYTINFNTEFNPDYTSDNFPTSFNGSVGTGLSVTALWLAQYTCEQVGISFGNTSFTNSDFSISSNQFTNNESCREVMKAISQLAFGWVAIDWDDRCYIRELDTSKDNIPEYNIINNDYYYSLTTQKNVYGPINRVIVGMEGVDGEASSIEDSSSITANGLTELYIYDNPLTYLEEQRLAVLANANWLLGISYTPLETETPGHPWLKGYNLIKVMDMNDNEKYTYPFNLTINYTGHIKTTIESVADTTVETTTAYDTSMYKSLKNVKITVDKQDGKITLLNESIDNQNSKISQVTQTVDELNSKISDIADITVSGESAYGSISLTDVGESEPIEMKIYPTTDSVSYLYPTDNVYPSDTTFLKQRTVQFKNTKTDEIISYELPDDLLYIDNDTYDEFTLNYENQLCQIIKRCGYSSRTIQVDDDLSGVTVRFDFPTRLNVSGRVTQMIVGEKYSIIDVNSYGYLQVQLYNRETKESIVLYSQKSGYDAVVNMADYTFPDDFGKVTNINLVYSSNKTIYNCIKLYFGIVKLDTPETVTYDYPTIALTDGDYDISLLGYSNAYIFTRLMANNIYTTQFATKVELNSAISQTESSITASVEEKITNVNGKIDTINGEVSLKVGKSDNDQIVSMLNASADEINIKSNRLTIDSDNFDLTKEGKITATSGEIAGFNMESEKLNNDVAGIYEYNKFDMSIAAMVTLNYLYGDSNITNILDANNDGSVNSADYLYIHRVILGTLTNTKTASGSFEINSNNPKYCMAVKDSYGNIASSMGVGGVNATYGTFNNVVVGYPADTLNDGTFITLNGNNGNVRCVSLTQTSQAEKKKNFEKLTNAKEILNATDIYKYNFKTEEDTDKKHIGFVIGDGYNYSQDITSSNNDGVDTYAMVSVLWQVVKEQQSEIDELKKLIKESDK